MDCISLSLCVCVCVCVCVLPFVRTVLTIAQTAAPTFLYSGVLQQSCIQVKPQQRIHFVCFSACTQVDFSYPDARWASVVTTHICHLVRTTSPGPAPFVSSAGCRRKSSQSLPQVLDRDLEPRCQTVAPVALRHQTRHEIGTAASEQLKEVCANITISRSSIVH